MAHRQKLRYLAEHLEKTCRQSRVQKRVDVKSISNGLHPWKHDGLGSEEIQVPMATRGWLDDDVSSSCQALAF